MARLRDKMREDLELRGRRAETIATYLRCVRRFFEHVGRLPAVVGAAEIRAYLLHLIRERKVHPATVNVYAAAICFFYRVTLRRSFCSPARRPRCRGFSHRRCRRGLPF